jgi:cation-transporting ATPase E
MGTTQLTEVVQEATLFASLTREQKGQIVTILREQGEHVATVGDSISDLSAMKAAHLSITTRGSSQAALSRADIVLLKSSLDVLPTVVQQGQKIVSGLLDILKLNLTQVGYLLLLIVAMVLSGRGIFYYHPTQGGVVIFFTLILPSVGLTLWATAGAIPRQRMSLQLVRFVIPAAFTLMVAVLLLSSLFGQSTESITYTQLAVTYGLITMGSLLVVFVQPPAKLFTGGDELSGDWRPTYLAIASLVLFNIIVFVPLAQEFLRIAPLLGSLDYAVIGVVAIFWGGVLLVIWRSRWFNKGMMTLANRLTPNKGKA